MELDEVFLPDEELKAKIEWVQEHVVKGMDWRNNRMHVRVYNELNFKLGVLDKIEAARKRITVDSSKEVIKLLYIIGYGTKQIAYWLWRFGFKGISHYAVQTHVRTQKRWWDKEREKFMKELEGAKDTIFQTMKDEVMSAEKRTLTILLEKLAGLQDALEKTDPVANPGTFNRINGLIEKIERKIKDSHGIDLFREGYVKATTEVAIHKGKLEADLAPQKPALTNNANPVIME